MKTQKYAGILSLAVGLLICSSHPLLAASPPLSVKVQTGLSEVKQVQFSSDPTLAWSVNESGTTFWDFKDLKRSDFLPHGVLDISARYALVAKREQIATMTAHIQQLEAQADVEKQLAEFRKTLAPFPKKTQETMLKDARKTYTQRSIELRATIAQIKKDPRYNVTVHQLNLYDRQKRQFVRPLNTSDQQASMYTQGAVTPDQAYALAVGNDTLKAFDVQTGALRWQTKASMSSPLALSSACRDCPTAFVAQGLANTIEVLDIHTGKSVKTLVGHTMPILALAFFQNGTKLASVSLDRSLRIWDVASGQEVVNIPAPAENALSLFSDVAVSPDDKYIAATGFEGYLNVWDTQTLSLHKRFPAHAGRVNSLAWSPDGKHLLTGGLEGSIKLWKAETFEEVLNATSDAQGEYIIWSKEGYFDASRGGGKLVSLVQGLNVFGIDQLAISKNRPDLLLAQVGYHHPDTQRYFFDRYQRRLQKSGLKADDASFVNPPTVQLLSSSQHHNQAKLKFAVNSPAPLKSYQIYANDVPLFPPPGKPLQGTSAQIEEIVALGNGENKLEISALDINGSESLRVLTQFKHSTSTRGDLYFIGFGVSRYQDTSLNLLYAHKDAVDMGKTFAKMNKAYHKIHTHVFTDEKATAQQLKAAKMLLKQAKVDDTVVVFIAGHGVHDPSDASTYYYLTHDTDLKRLSQTAVAFEDIEDLLQGIAPRNKLFLMDTCESGEVDAVEQRWLQAQAHSAQFKARAVRGVRITSATSPIPVKTSSPVRSFLQDRERYIFNDLFRRSGTMVFSSSRGGEFSYEPSQFKSTENGFFTQAILQAMTSPVADTNKDGWLSRQELTQYVSIHVAKRTQGLQNPIVDRDNTALNLKFPIVK